MTAVLAVLLVLGAVVLCAAAWHTRHPGAPGVPDRENGALTAWDPAELREWTLELHHTKSTPPWLPRPADEWTTEEAHADEPRDLRRAPGTRSRADAGMRAVPPGVQRVHEEVAGGEERVEDGETGRPVAVPGIGPGLAAHGDPVAELTGAAERIRALSLDEYEAAFPGWEHGTGWFRAIDGGEVAR